MTTTLKQFATVGENGKLDLIANLPEGTKVEIIILVQEQDETEYLLSTAANRQHLIEAIKEANDRVNYIYIDPQTL
jgi:antitoxin YefM